MCTSDVAEGKLKALEEMDVIWLDSKLMWKDVAEERNAPEGMDVIWLEAKPIHWIEVNFEISLGILVRLLLYA